MYSQNFECFLKCFHFLTTKTKKQKNNSLIKKKKKSTAPWQGERSEWPQNTLLLSVTWVFTRLRNLLGGCSDSNRFSSTFPATLLEFMFSRDSSSFASPTAVLFRNILETSSGFTDLLSICLVCEMREETKEGKNIMESRHLKKKTLRNRSRHIFKKWKEGALIRWVGREQSRRQSRRSVPWGSPAASESRNDTFTLSLRNEGCGFLGGNQDTKFS